MLPVEERVDRLESLFEDFITHSEYMQQRTDRILLEMRQQAKHDRERTDRILAEMREQAKQDWQRTEKMFAEMREQADKDREQADKMFAEMREQADRDRERTDKMLAETREQANKDREQADKDRQKADSDRRELNKKWGELANRLGTVAEDIVAPNLPRIAREQFGCPEEPDDFMVRRWVRHKVDHSKRREFDVIVVYPEKVIINETKSTPRINYIDDFIAILSDIEGYFPEYQGKTIIPIFTGLSIPDNLQRYLTKHKIYALAMGDETMELLNFEQVSQS